MDYYATIRRELTHCLQETDLGIGSKKNGKVRDTYDLGNRLVLVTTDRQSAFDRILAAVPFKGQVLNLVSAWWFEKTAHIIPNHVISVPDPNVTIAKKCAVFPVEVIVRGYITGTTDTSAWVNYQKGMRAFCGNILPEGLVKNQRLPSPIVTPTTKDDHHDRLISGEEIVRSGLMTMDDWAYVEKKALELFLYGQALAREHGLILVDTKYEFGKDAEGVIRLIDEVHTPDSSRYWLAASYEERFERGEEPEYIDKEFLRLWFAKHSDPYADAVLPAAPEELVVELSRRYIQLYEMITGMTFQFPKETESPAERMRANIKRDSGTSAFIHAPARESKKSANCVLILGSDKDRDHAQKITNALDASGISWDLHVASAHKQAHQLLHILNDYQNQPIIYITIAGRSNALSGFVAGNSTKPTIACPPFADKIDMLTNINSTLQMPSDVPVMTILDPGNVARAVERMLCRH